VAYRLGELCLQHHILLSILTSGAGNNIKSETDRFNTCTLPAICKFSCGMFFQSHMKYTVLYAHLKKHYRIAYI